jgi:hypothetical protein
MIKKPFKEICSRLSELKRFELIELKSIIEAILNIEKEHREKYPTVAPLSNKKLRYANGHIELKLIRGFGPYMYLRYWSGKKLKSVYIGKAKKSKG